MGSTSKNKQRRTRVIHEVYVTPASGVGGEFPRPARWSSSRRVVELYADACRAIGQKARIVTRAA